MTGPNQWRLENGSKIDVIMKTQIESAPQILIFQLQRFSFDDETGVKTKYFSSFSFPDSFDFAPFMVNSKNKKYKLIGIINHSGDVVNGHYVSYIRMSEDRWAILNDSSMGFVDHQTVMSLNQSEGESNAYVLFYEVIESVNLKIPISIPHDQSEENRMNFVLKPTKRYVDLCLKDLFANQRLKYIEFVPSIIANYPYLRKHVRTIPDILPRLENSNEYFPHLSQIVSIILEQLRRSRSVK